MKTKPIDIVIPWVDGNDPVWKKEKEAYLLEATTLQRRCNKDNRFQSWDNLQYLFRSIEECMPWVRKVFFVTWGHIPSFLNLKCEKLEIVNHEDFIPHQYLPTFNINTIEMNLHRIKDLSDNFIYFNDDVIPLKYHPETYFFKNDMICDEAVERIVAPRFFSEGDIMLSSYRAINDMCIINKYFNKREVQRKNFFKWYNLKYGKNLLRNIALHYFYDFDYITNHHVAVALQKSTYEKIWSLEPEILDATCKNKFRNYSDVNFYLIRIWNLCEGKFYPRKTKGKSFLVSDNNYERIADMIQRKEYPMVCINEASSITDFNVIKNRINSALETLFPEKSKFEL